ncbi:MAG TPA: helix-turn-helix transcriptional regulator [Trebonia sp.]|nr:helix-turn-helix transcriptional regulator [Trebonia sp.]
MAAEEASVPEGFGAALRGARTASGMSLRELGERTHYSKGHLSKIENELVGGNLDLARTCDSVLATEGRLTRAFLSQGGRPGPAAAPADTALDAQELLRTLAVGLLAQSGGRPGEAALHQLVSGYRATAAAADELVSPQRYRAAGAPRAGHFADRGDAMGWCDEMAEHVPLLCSLAFELGCDEDCWRLAYAFRGYFFTVRALRPWATSHRIALRAAERAGNQWAQAMTRNNLGLVLLEQGRASAAEAQYGAALGIFRDLGDDHGVAATLGHQAWASYVAGHPAATVDLAAAANRLSRRHGNERSLAIMDRTAALAYSRLGQHAKALYCLAECQEILDRIDLPLDAAMLANCLGEVHFAMGAFGRAADCHAQAGEQATACGGVAEAARAERLYWRAASMSSTVMASP